MSKNKKDRGEGMDVGRPVWGGGTQRGKDYGYVWVKEDKGVWHEEIPVYDVCPHMAPMDVFISGQVIADVRGLCRETNTEFLIYLLGVSDGDNVFVEDYYLPEQEVTYGSVEVTEKVEIEGIVGALHKHPWKGKTRFSMTDDSCLNVNHDLSIVVPGDGDWGLWETYGRRRADDYYVKVPVKLHVLISAEPDMERIETLKARMMRPKYLKWDRGKKDKGKKSKRKANKHKKDTTTAKEEPVDPYDEFSYYA